MMEAHPDTFRVTLLGTGAPPPSLERFGPSTLVEAGAQKFIFDAGRGAMQRLNQLAIPFSAITGMFLTHHHSDHVVGFPDLWLTGWIGLPWGKRASPLPVWGPEGTAQMMQHLPLAFATDLRIRGKHYPPAGAELQAREIREGVVFEQDGVKVTAFRVDHGGEELSAYGYRIDYKNRSALLSGDTTFNENLIRHAAGVDLLVHEVIAARGAAENPEQMRRIAANHTTPEQAGEVFRRANPKLAVYTHLLLFGGFKAEELIPTTRKNYAGPLVVGEDLLQIEIGEEVTTRALQAKAKTSTPA
jgi:ribonuclease Z